MPACSATNDAIKPTPGGRVTPAAPQRVASQRSNGVGVATTREDTYALHELSPCQLFIRHRAIFLALHRI